ncbi:MAG: hypothetical protein AVDCRST_MAG22-3373, partial [uncultured Rubrobacteraceae bacterium]
AHHLRGLPGNARSPPPDAGLARAGAAKRDQNRLYERPSQGEGPYPEGGSEGSRTRGGRTWCL